MVLLQTTAVGVVAPRAQHAYAMHHITTAFGGPKGYPKGEPWLGKSRRRLYALNDSTPPPVLDLASSTSS